MYNKIVNLEAPSVSVWLPTASDHQVCPTDTLLADYLTAWRELDQLLRIKFGIVGDAEKVFRELRFQLDNGHLFETSRNSAVRDALRHLIPAPFSEERRQQRTPLPLEKVCAALGEGQPAVEHLLRRKRLLGRIYSR